MQSHKTANEEERVGNTGPSSGFRDRIENAGNQAVLLQMAVPEKADTGIPEELKARVENRSGFSLDDVKVHYNSDKPGKVGALAYTQGSQVYIGQGQEHNLAHELGHVIQQKEGRVRATGTVNGQSLNDDISLEREADSYR